MPAMNVLRSVEIESNITHIHSILMDFKQWPVWSPWLIQEPACKPLVASDGQSYSWDGSRVGAGNMRIIDATETQIDYELNFIRPWKSSAEVQFKLVAKSDERTEVSWSMKSSLPIFLFWLKKMMQAFVGMDYERGLSMLKAYAETGQVPSKLEFDGETEFSGCQFVGLKNTCKHSEIGEVMPGDCEKLATFLMGIDDVIAGPMFSVYHKFNPVKDIVEYTVGMPVKREIDDLPGEYVSSSIPKLKAFKLSHIGAYHFLGNAWTTLYAMERAKEIKCDKIFHPFEVYLNMPGEVPEAELKTEIYFPMK